jgi:putative endonuclease
MPQAHIYILRCADGSYYTGLTRRDPAERASEHGQGLDPGCYTYRRRPVELVYSEAFDRVDEAVATERRIKGWTRAKKEALIARNYDEIARLASRKRK